MTRPFERELQHHVTMWPVDYDGRLGQALAAGYQVEQDGQTHRGRFVYLRHPANADQIVEFTEATPARQAFNAAIEAAGRGWDGSDPVRPFSAAG
jgi:hypothetical protein